VPELPEVTPHRTYLLPRPTVSRRRGVYAGQAVIVKGGYDARVA